MHCNSANNISVTLERILLGLYGLIVFSAGFSSYKSPGIFITVALLAVSAWRICRNENSAVLKIFTGQGFYLLITLQLAGWAAAIWVNYLSFKYNNFDTGIFANLIYEFFRSGNYYSSILEIHGLGDHFAPALTVLSPLFNLPFNFTIILYCKILAYFITAWLLLLISKQVLGANDSARFIIPILFITNCYVGTSLAAEFQPSCLTLPLIAMAFLLLEKESYITAAGVLILLLDFKEHLGLALISAGIFLIFFKDKKLAGLAVAGTGAAAGFYLHFFLMPAISGTPSNLHGGRFGPFDLLEMKAIFLMKLFLSVGFLPLFDLRSLLFILPAFGISLVSKHDLMLKLIFHYHDIGMVILMIGSIYGLKRLLQMKEKLLFNQLNSITVLNLICIFALIAQSWAPSRTIHKSWPVEQHSSRLKEIQDLSARLEQGDCSPSKTYAMDNLGPYFFKMQNLKTILTGNHRFFSDGNEIVILASQADKIPLTEEEFGHMLQRLEAAAVSGRIAKITSVSSDLLVFAGWNYPAECREQLKTAVNK